MEQLINFYTAIVNFIATILETFGIDTSKMFENVWLPEEETETEAEEA